MEDPQGKCYDGHEAPVAECAACAENETPAVGKAPETLEIHVHEEVKPRTRLA